MAIFLRKYFANHQERSENRIKWYFRERLSENSVSKLFVHDNEAARSGEELAHLSKSDLIAGEDEDIESDVFAENALYEGIVVFFGIGEMGNVLALAQLLRRSHLLLEIWPYGHSGASRARISNQIHDSRREDGYLTHAD